MHTNHTRIYIPNSYQVSCTYLPIYIVITHSLPTHLSMIHTHLHKYYWGSVKWKYGAL
jgi:hypothetical protein